MQCETYKCLKKRAKHWRKLNEKNHDDEMWIAADPPAVFDLEGMPWLVTIDPFSFIAHADNRAHADHE